MGDVDLGLLTSDASGALDVEPIERRDLRQSGALVFGEDLRERFGVEPLRGSRR